MVRTGVRVRAPQLQGAGGWINTDGPLDLKALGGRVVVLDFWTFACVNCLHVIDELRPLEAKYPDDVVVIGVHSPKFAHEAEHAAVVAAVARLGIAHAVLDDPGLLTWAQYAVKAWPTLVVIDPEGYVVAQAAGEGQVSALDAIIAEVLGLHRARGTVEDGARPGRPVRSTRSTRPVGSVGSAPVEPGALYFPAKAIVVPAARSGRAADTVLVADAGRHALTELGLDGQQVLSRIGTGKRGRSDGSSAQAEFAEPSGLTLLPAAVAGEVGYDVLVADTANHLLRGVRLDDGSVRTVTDLATVELHTITGRVPGVMSPWDVAWWPAAGTAVVAAAGVHLLLAFDPRTGAVTILAGTTVEGMRDGDALDAWLAQPSGLAADGDRMWFTDAETSSLRWLDTGGPGTRDQVHSAIGEGLFDFGHVDGPAAQARLQHPLGVAVLADGAIAIADTFNGAVRRFELSTGQVATGQVTTTVDGLAEPSGLLLVAGELVAVESAAHRLTPVNMTPVLVDPGPTTATPTIRTPTTGTSTADEPGGAMQVIRPATDLRPGVLVLSIGFTPAPGRVVDDRSGPATRLDVSASPPELLLDGAGDSTDLTRTLRLADPAAGGPSAGVLHVSAQAASCDHDPAVANPACYLSRQDWGIPVRLRADGQGELELVLLG